MSELAELRAMWAAAQTDDEREQIAALAADAKAETLPLATWALHYARCGIAVFPCVPGGKRPATGSGGFKNATTDADQITAWWTAMPRANIGTPTGRLFDAIDIDGPAGYLEFATSGMRDDATRDALGRTITPRGGTHWLMPPTGGRNKTAVLPQVDLRGDGGYIVLPPSLGANSRRYTWAFERLGIGVPAA